MAVCSHFSFWTKRELGDAGGYPAGRSCFSFLGDPFGLLISMWHDGNPNEDHWTCMILAAALQGIKHFLHHGSSARTRHQKPLSAFKAGSHCPRALSFLADES